MSVHVLHWVESGCVPIPNRGWPSTEAFVRLKNEMKGLYEIPLIANLRGSLAFAIRLSEENTDGRMVLKATARDSQRSLATNTKCVYVPLPMPDGDVSEKTPFSWKLAKP